MTTNFEILPTEIKLNILSQVCEQIPSNISNQWTQLSQYITSQKLLHYLQSNELYISLFCPNSKTPNKKLIYSLSPSQSSESISFKINKLVKTQEIIPMESAKDQYDDSTASQHLDLLIDEEQSSFKLHIQLRLNDTVIKESGMSIHLSEFQNPENSKVLDKNAISYKMKLLQGEEEKRGGYDFTDLINYSFNLENLEMSTNDFIECVEKKEGCMIVRY